MNDNAPVGNTCGDIDKVSQGIIDAYEALRHEDIDSAESVLVGLNNTLEQIRSDNAELRKWGNEQYQRAEDTEDAIKCMQDEITDLENQL